jgi:hypothetical protein
MLRDIKAPTFSRVGSQMVLRLSALCANCPFPHEDSWYSFLLEAEFTPGLEGLGQLENPVTSLGIKPIIFVLVA